jgi:AraC-like DNA-binding protein
MVRAMILFELVQGTAEFRGDDMPSPRAARADKHHLFIKILMILILVTIVPIDIISVVGFTIARSNLREEVIRSSSDLLRQTRSGIDLILRNTESIYRKISRNNTVQEFLSRDVDLLRYDDIELVKTVQNVLQSFKEGTSYIDEIGVYSGESRMLFSTQTGEYTRFGTGDTRGMDELVELASHKLWVTRSERMILDETDRIQFLKLIYGNTRSIGFVLITLVDEEILNLVQTLHSRASSYMAVVDDAGSVIVNSRGNEAELPFDPAQLDSRAGHTRLSVDGKNLLVTHHTSDYNGWKYVAVLDEKELYSGIDTVRNLFLVVGAVFTGLVLLLSFVVARGFYRPISIIERLIEGTTTGDGDAQRVGSAKNALGHVMAGVDRLRTQLEQERDQRLDVSRENLELKVDLRRNYVELKKYLMYSVLYCGEPDTKELTRQSQLLEISLSSVFYALVVQLDEASAELLRRRDKRETADTRTALLDELRTALSRIAAPKIVFYEEESRIVAVFAERRGEELDCETVRDAAAGYLRTIGATHGLTGSVAVGDGRHCGLEGIRDAYHEATTAMRSRFFAGADDVVPYSALKSDPEIESTLDARRSRLEEALLVRDADEIAAVLDEVRSAVRRNLKNHAQNQYYCRSVVRVVHDFVHDSCRVPKSARSAFDEKTIDLEKSFRNIDEAISWIVAFVTSDRHGAKADAGSQMHEKAAEAVRIIHEEYKNDVSLELIADRLAVSPAYLSRLFRKEVGRTFMSYLTEYKIEQAKKLFRQSNLSVCDVASAVGYNHHKQFIRMFKKVTGTTPGKYRAAITF